MSLRRLFRDIGRRKDSRIVSAIDVTVDEWDIYRLREFMIGVSPYVVGFKIGIPTIFSFGLDNLNKIFQRIDDTLFIADVKLADIGYIGRKTSELIYKSGFHAIIIHGFIGFEGGLKDIIGYAYDIGLSTILVAAMSHPGGEEYINRFTRTIIEKSLELPIDGYILPATYPNYIREFRDLIGDRLILCPGVGAQGAKPGSAIDMGADGEIIGRLIYMDEKPISRVRELHGVLRWRRRG